MKTILALTICVLAVAAAETQPEDPAPSSSRQGRFLLLKKGLIIGKKALLVKAPAIALAKGKGALLLKGGALKAGGLGALGAIGGVGGAIGGVGAFGARAPSYVYSPSYSRPVVSVSRPVVIARPKPVYVQSYPKGGYSSYHQPQYPTYW